ADLTVRPKREFTGCHTSGGEVDGRTAEQRGRVAHQRRCGGDGQRSFVTAQVVHRQLDETRPHQVEAGWWAGKAEQEVTGCTAAVQRTVHGPVEIRRKRSPRPVDGCDEPFRPGVVGRWVGGANGTRCGHRVDTSSRGRDWATRDWDTERMNGPSSGTISICGAPFLLSWAASSICPASVAIPPRRLVFIAHAGSRCLCRDMGTRYSGNDLLLPE